MHTDDYLLLRKGFYSKREYEQALVRKGVELVVAPWVKSGFNIKKYWPIGSEIEEASKAQDEAVKTLNYLKANEGKFVYAKVNGVIVEVPINDN